MRIGRDRFRMSLNRIAGVGQQGSLVAPQPIGVSAQFADVRAKLRAIAPQGSVDGLFDEARRLQAKTGMTPLQALHEVYRKVANGWVPANGV